ncbi:FecR family protein [Flavitalea flava]
MSSERRWILLAKKKSGEATREELAELKSLLQAEEGSNYAHEVLDKLWETPLHPVPEMMTTRSLWNRIQKRLDSGVTAREDLTGNGVRVIGWRKWLAAASILVILGSVTALYMGNRFGKTIPVLAKAALNQVATQAGSKTRLELPDGTLVWLNANSQLTYGNKSFGTEEREVTLSGEAFFDVVKNEKLPFIIHTKDITVRVLGTAFNIRAYPREKTVETSLIRGLVEVITRHDPDRKIILKPNEKIIVPVDAAPSSLFSIVKLQKDSAQAVPETGWVKNKLEFDNELFEELAPKMENWYNIRIHFQDEQIRKRRFSGVIEKETLAQTLDAMKLSGHFSYEIKGDELWLKEK